MTSTRPPSNLTRRIIEYQETGENLHCLIEQVALLVYRFPARVLGWEEDDCSDFFCWFLPRIPRMIERFTYIGKNFEAYLFVTLKWQCRTFGEKKRRISRDTRLFTCREFWPEREEEEAAACEPSPRLFPVPVRRALRIEDDKIPDDTSKRRLLYLTMTGAECITTKLLEQVSLVTGFDIDWLFSCAEQLRQGLAAKRERLEMLREKRNRAFLQIYRIHQELPREHGTEGRQLLLEKLRTEKKRLATSLEEMSRVPSSPTHKEIAAVLGVPKGSVDSGIYYLKNAIDEHCA